MTEFPDGFSVLMALYQGDKAGLFDKALNSVFSNTLQPNQILLVIDGPIPSDLENVLVKFHESFPDRIEEFRLKENLGLANALNEGLKHVSHEWVVRADADDINLPKRFETLAAMIHANPDLDILGSAIMEVDEAGNILAQRIVPCEQSAILKYAQFRNPFNHMSVAYKCKSILGLGGYPNLYLKEDYALWAKALANQLMVANTKEVLVHATTSSSMYERRGGLRLAKTEIELQELLVVCGLKTKLRALTDGVVRAGFCLVPSQLRKLLYLKLLRVRAE
jgi:glycosyltransferase involved in cell wall biosynthesis